MISVQNVLLTVLLSSVSLSSAMPILGDQFMDLEARDGGSCYPLGIDQIKKLPGWGKIEQYAKDNFGEGGVNVITNPSEYQDRPANACMNVARVKLEWAEKPQCSETKKAIQGKSSGTGTEVVYTQRTGTDQSSTLSVTRSSELCTAVSFSVGVEFPGLVSASTSVSTSSTIKNERASTFTTSKNDVRETKFTTLNEDGKSCKMAIKSKDCSAKARGRLPVVASGFVWFNYDDKRAHRKTGGSEHYKWTVNIADVLSEAERTSFVEFEGPMNAVSNDWYDVDCKKTPKKPKKKAAVQKAVKKAAKKPVAKARAIAGKPKPQGK